MLPKVLYRIFMKKFFLFFFVTGGVRVSWTLMTVVRGCGSRSCNCRLVMVWCLTVVVVGSGRVVGVVLVVL